MLIKDEKVEAIFEYSPDKLVMSVYPTDIIIVHNFKVVKIIYKIELGNFNKHWIAPLPGFDEISFPFLLCSGRQNFTLINVEKYKMMKLIQAPCMNVRC